VWFRSEVPRRKRAFNAASAHKRFLAVIALVAVIAAFIYVLRHLQKVERMITSDNHVPAQRGPRNNVVLTLLAPVPPHECCSAPTLPDENRIGAYG
jgi:flagellar biogenesis protein FliO